MRVIEFDDPIAYRERVLPLLIEHECENCSMIGIVGRLADGKPATRSGVATVPLLLVVEDGRSDVIAAALQTPPHAMLVSPSNQAITGAIARALYERVWITGEFVAIAPTARAMAADWHAVTGRAYTRRRALRVFRVERVIDPPPAGGRLRVSTIEDLPLLSEWAATFAREIGEPLDDATRPTRTAIEEGRLHIWIDDNGTPRASCAWAGPTPNGIRINQVYTPPQLRGRGYASNATAELTRRLLASGRRFCFLFTDASNTTSNSIYQKIGYRHVADLEHLKFEP